MKTLKIGYFADGIWGHNAFQKIQEDKNLKIAFICPRYHSKDEKLIYFSKKYNINYIQHENINSDDFLKKIDKYKCDLLVSMSFNQIFKHQILERYKIINCHAGKLPFYRGRNILNWVLINDEKEFGTVHFVDEGIDTGDIIILQKTFPISDNDTYASLLEIAHIQCAEILYEATIQFTTGNIKTIKQTDIHPVGMYCGVRKNGDEIIDWTMTTRELFNFIRSISKPGPMAKCMYKQFPLYINRAEIIPNAPIYKGISGQILHTDNEHFVVKTNDSILKITSFFCDEHIKVGARLH